MKRNEDESEIRVSLNRDENKCLDRFSVEHRYQNIIEIHHHHVQINWNWIINTLEMIANWKL